MDKTRMPEDYAVGADLSFLSWAESHGTIFKDGGIARPGLRIFREHGYNWIRLRLFNAPTDLPNNLEYTVALASKAKRMGYKFLLDFHYSDTWADPGKQTVPRAWADLGQPELVKAVFDYTRRSVEAFREATAEPDMVQVGNEITPGMLWPAGRVPENWPGFAELLVAGIEGVKAASTARIMIHIDRGGDSDATGDFFDRLDSFGVRYDVIGQSYYPWWHGSIDDLRANLAFMAGRYDKDIILVETAYCWQPTEYIDKPGPYPETPEGQRLFLEEVNRAVLETPEGKGKGVFWWEPAVMGDLRCRGMFDDAGEALAVLSVFDTRR